MFIVNPRVDRNVCQDFSRDARRRNKRQSAAHVYAKNEGTRSEPHNIDTLKVLSRLSVALWIHEYERIITYRHALDLNLAASGMPDETFKTVGFVCIKEDELEEVESVLTEEL